MDKIPHQSRLSINGMVYKINPDGTNRDTDVSSRHQILYFDGMSEEEAAEKMDRFLKRIVELWKTTI